MAQIGNALSVVLLEPEGGIDVACGGRGAHDAPVGAVKVLPCELFTVVDLCGKLLALFRGAGDKQCAVGDRLAVGSLGGLSVVPVFGVVGVLAQAVAGGGQDDVAAVVIEDIGAAGHTQAHINGAGAQALAHGLIGGAHGDIHFTHIIALLCQLVLQQLLERLGDGDDLIRLSGRDESDAQGVDPDIARRGARRGLHWPPRAAPRAFHYRIPPSAPAPSPGPAEVQLSFSWFFLLIVYIQCQESGIPEYVVPCLEYSMPLREKIF